MINVYNKVLKLPCFVFAFLVKQRLLDKNPSIPDRVVSIALDSVDYDENKAAQILEMMQKDENKRSRSLSPEKIIRYVILFVFFT